MRVLKFGGSSIADVESIGSALSVVRSRLSAPLVLVFSAIGSTTDCLQRIAELAAAGSLDETVDIDRVRAAFPAYRSPLMGHDLPSAPARPVVLADGFARPQPVLDRDRGDGMTVTVGRLEPCPVLDYRYVALVHNTVRGAAGGTLLVAEMLVAMGVV